MNQTVQGQGIHDKTNQLKEADRSLKPQTNSGRCDVTSAQTDGDFKDDVMIFELSRASIRGHPPTKPSFIHPTSLKLFCTFPRAVETFILQSI